LAAPKKVGWEGRSALDHTVHLLLKASHPNESGVTRRVWAGWRKAG
jgi:hypothetical protein